MALVERANHDTDTCHNPMPHTYGKSISLTLPTLYISN